MVFQRMWAASHCTYMQLAQLQLFVAEKGHVAVYPLAAARSIHGTSKLVASVITYITQFHVYQSLTKVEI